LPAPTYDTLIAALHHIEQNGW